MDAVETSELLVQWALEAGFDRAGIAVLGAAERGDAYTRWIEAGRQAGMGYLERRMEERLDPRTVLAGARSAVCVALHYYPHEAGESVPGDLWPSVARYARGRDYHQLMEERLRRLASRIEHAFPGTSTRPYVDTGPVLERELAARAGLGAIGKNTNLLAHDGSWFLLGELFLTLDLVEGGRLADLCGACTACLDACPTGAFPEPWVLDSNRCISYWTIEHRGPIPEAMREAIGSWVFGCDVCQEVCPLNAVPMPATESGFLPAGERRQLRLADVLGLERERYLELFRGSAMKRAKLEGLKRNVAVVMGNRRSADDVEALAGAMRDSDATVRSHAAWALGRIDTPAARRVLREALASEGENAVVVEIYRALRLTPP